jgi:WS/DGAT/MGAT family acyltransferase
LYLRAAVRGVGRVPGLARLSAETAARVAGAGDAVPGGLTSLLGKQEMPTVARIAEALRKPPATRFAGKVSAHRVVEVVGLPLVGFKTVRASIPEATINDLFMTTVGGALRRYLEAKGELPEATLTCMVPMSFRGPDKTADVGNQIGMAVMPLHTELHDPIDRLQEIRRGAAKAKAFNEVVGRDLAARLFELLPDAASELATRRLVLPQMSIVVSNVRGPDVPLFMAGARLVSFAPVSIAFDGLGLNVTGFSYHGMLWICAVACRDMLPDPAFFAECLRASFAELERTAAAVPSPDSAAITHSPPPKAVRTRSRGTRNAPAARRRRAT